MIDRAVLHIGLEKTGTTSVQGFLTNNRDALERDGIVYSRSAGQNNHLKLTCYAANPGVDAFRKLFSISSISDLKSFRRKFERDLEEEAARASSASNCTTIVFSNEHCHSRLTTPEEISRLFSLIKRVARTVNVIMYLRRQDKMAVSRFSTLVRVGASPKRVLPDLHPGEYHGSYFPYYFAFWRIYKNYSDVFGEENVKVRLYDRLDLKEGDVVADFMDVMEITNLDGYRSVKVMNEALSGKALFFLQEMRRALADQKEILWSGSDFQKIARKLAAEYSGSGVKPARHEAERFFEFFADENEKVRSKLFSARASLFEQDFSCYPEQEEAFSCDHREILKMAFVAAR